MTRPDLDVLLLCRTELRLPPGRLTELGWSPAFAVGAVTVPPVVNPSVIGQPVTGTAQFARDPAFPDLPTAEELIARHGRRLSPDLASARRAVASAATLDAALVLPQQTPAAVVAWWRQGCTALAAAAEIQVRSDQQVAHPLSPAATAALLKSIAIDAPAMLDLRRWMADRYQWQPS